MWKLALQVFRISGAITRVMKQCVDVVEDVDPSDLVNPKVLLETEQGLRCNIVAPVHTVLAVGINGPSGFEPSTYEF
jgi:hypothetical protein